MKIHVLKGMFYITIIFHKEVAKNISEFPLLCQLNTNDPLTDYENSTCSMWIRNSIPYYIIYINKHLLSPRTPYIYHFVACNKDCNLIPYFIHNMANDMVPITSNSHLCKGYM